MMCEQTALVELLRVGGLVGLPIGALLLGIGICGMLRSRRDRPVLDAVKDVRDETVVLPRFEPDSAELAGGGGVGGRG